MPRSTSRDSASQATRRSLPSAPFQGVSGAGEDSRVPADSRMRPTSRVRASATPGRIMSRTSAASARERRAPSSAMAAAAFSSDGTMPERTRRRGTRGICAGTASGGVPSKVVATPAVPSASAREWCAFTRIVVRPPLRSENAVNSHGGRSAGSARDQTCATARASVASSAASSSSTTCTCLLGRNEGSGDQPSRSAASGRRAGLLRSSGWTSAARDAARTTSRRSRPPSKKTSAPACSSDPSSALAYEVACSSRSRRGSGVNPGSRARARTGVR